MKIDKILGWNDCIETLHNNGILSDKDLVKVWQVTTPKQRQEEYYKK